MPETEMPKQFFLSPIKILMRHFKPVSRVPLSRIAVAALALALFCSAMIVGLGGAVNNGDFSRVFDSMAIYAPGWQPLHATYNIDRSAHVATPSSLMGALGWSLSRIYLLFGISAFNTWSITIILAALNLGGMFALASLRSREGDVTLLYCVVVSMVFGLYFRSLFEEAALLALSPTLAYFALNCDRKHRAILIVAVGALVLLAKAQMIFMLPLIVLSLFIGKVQVTRRKIVKIAAYALGLAVICMGYNDYLKNNGGMSPVNNYNRLYNGVGYSLLLSATWPAHNFNDRLTYFYDNREKLQASISAHEPVTGLSLLGTSYWPTGAELSGTAWAPSATSAQKKKVEIVIDAGAMPNYLSYIATKPSTAMLIGINALMTSYTASYALDYLRDPDAPLRLYSKLASWIGAGLFQASALLLLSYAAWRKSKYGLLVALYFFVGAPVFIVIGDGFFEFEKHMAPYLMLLPFVAAMVLSPHHGRNGQNG